MVKFSEKEIRFLNYMRVGRLATTDGEAIHLVPICPVFDGAVFYMASHGKTRKVRNLRKNNRASLLVDQYSEDWMRHVATMMTGTVDIIEKGLRVREGQATLGRKVSAVQRAVSDKRRRKRYPVLQADQGGDMGLRSGRT
jgi:nitroimidazol reductase NimA-like FMN-containing flavoprotein (pyridoxamine 5'-phosphate oxidase superfamily)